MAARIFSEKLRIIHYTLSLGYHRSLIFYMPAADLTEAPFNSNPVKPHD